MDAVCVVPIPPPTAYVGTTLLFVSHDDLKKMLTKLGFLLVVVQCPLRSTYYQLITKSTVPCKTHLTM